MGADVSGCDVRDNEQTRALRQQGCTCLLGHGASHVDGVDVVVYSSAIKPGHPELQRAAQLGIPTYRRAHMLAQIQQDKQTVGVVGAHGKTTTTWLAAHTLITAALHPSVMVGGRVAALRGNWRVGHGPHFVTEIDESDGSLLEFEPTWSIVTNIDSEHLDHYRDLDDIRQTFVAYLRRTKPGGCVIACADDPEVLAALSAWSGAKLTYSLGRSGGDHPAGGAEPPADFVARNVQLGPTSSAFDVEHDGRRIGPLALSLPGRHNVQNALAVVALAHRLGISTADLQQAFASVIGVGRRLQRVGACGGVTVLDDYAHHPCEVKATLEAARRIAPGKLIGVFQPHRFTRTKLLCDQFGGAFDELDHLLLAPVYAAGEAPIEGVDSGLIARRIAEHGRVRCEMAVDLAAVPDRLRGLVQPGDTVITLGAGNVHCAGEALLRQLRSVPAAPVSAG